jgi:hypothetical protein
MLTCGRNISPTEVRMRWLSEEYGHDPRFLLFLLLVLEFEFGGDWFA